VRFAMDPNAPAMQGTRRLQEPAKA
jgi:hypothetical protein